MHDETIHHAGLTFRVTTEYDSGHGEPWEECDGHGPVSDWRRHYRGDTSKRPGEVVLHSERGSARFYDWQEALAIAKRDGWGLSDADMAKLSAKLGRSPTRGEVAAEAVRKDFDCLRRWCNDEWWYVGVVVTLLDTAGSETHESESVWGIESDNDAHIAEIAQDLAEELAARIGTTTELHYMTAARSTTIQIRA